MRLGHVGSMILDFNENHKGNGITLHPEFGNWMVEAVPSEPYESTENPQVVLSVKSKISSR